MDLGERKKRILRAIIDDYIETADPVGSRTIAKNSELGLSSATIRNEMADLEEMGFLEQPHTSAGRIPSYLGYRTYVDNLMQKCMVRFDEINELQREMTQKTKEIEFYLKKVLKITSERTNLTAIGITPDYNSVNIKKFELIKLDSHNFVLIIVTDNGKVKSKNISLSSEITVDILYALKDILNENLAGRSLQEIMTMDFSMLVSLVNYDKQLIKDILEFVYVTLNEIGENDVLLAGETNMLALPEFRDVYKARELLDLLHDKEKLQNLFKTHARTDSVNIVIGKESNDKDIEELSMVVSTYKISEGIYGAIGILGPMRMDYSKATSALEHITKSINESLLREYFGENND